MKTDTPKIVQNYAQLNLPETLAKPLHKALSFRRGSGTASEIEFVAWLAAYCAQYAALKGIDEAGNLYFEVLKEDGQKASTIFACHVDTVTNNVGQGSYRIAGSTLIAGEGEDCLGADDGAGIAILCHMMSNGVPGMYLWCRAEEVGAAGSQYLAENFDFTPYKRSICFDRAGTSEIITVQSGERLASSEFAEALSVAFQEQDLLYVESVNGVFTDNALWGEKLAENINLSAGYFAQHGPNESLNLTHLEALAAAVIKIDWEALPTCREPGIVEDLVFAAIDKEWQEACVKAGRGDFKFFQEQGFRIKDLRLVDGWSSLELASAWEIEQYLEETLTEENLNEIHQTTTQRPAQGI